MAAGGKLEVPPLTCGLGLEELTHARVCRSDHWSLFFRCVTTALNGIANAHLFSTDALLDPLPQKRRVADASHTCNTTQLLCVVRVEPKGYLRAQASSAPYAGCNLRSFLPGIWVVGIPLDPRAKFVLFVAPHYSPPT